MPANHPRPGCPGYRQLRVSRRACLTAGVLGSAGLSAADLLRARAASASPRGTRADAVIFLFIAGGVSHIDTFDPKPDAPAEIRSLFAPVETSVPGVRFTDQVPRLAREMHRMALLRAMTHGDFTHESAWELTCSGWPRTPNLTYPNLGSVVSRELGGRNRLPATVGVPGNTYMAGHSACFSHGYLPARHRMFPVNAEPSAADFAVRDVALPAGVDERRYSRRRTLLERVDGQIRRIEEGGLLEQADDFQQSAFAAVSSPAAKRAFDLRSEPQKVREAYGLTRLGQRFLLARRLVEAGVPFVTVDDDSWDHHSSIFDTLKSPDRLPQLDQAMAALLADLADRGLLQRTLVAFTSEFGRTPKINRDAGRDHYPVAYSQILAGAGVRGGQALGASDATGAEPESRPVTVPDFSATLLHALGIDPGRVVETTIGRPMPLTNGGTPIAELWG